MVSCVPKTTQKLAESGHIFKEGIRVETCDVFIYGKARKNRKAS